MQVLVADDDAVMRQLLRSVMPKWGYDVVMTQNGEEAWRILREPTAPTLAVLDWMMPGLDGVEVCRRARTLEHGRGIYVVMLTGKDEKTDLVAALDAGADDYLTKPFHPDELRARLQAGARIVELQGELGQRVHELEAALANIKMLHGLLPICSYCKKIRDDQNYWQQVESYVERHADVQFSHSICPDCYRAHVEPEMETRGEEGLGGS
jgi:DNA-binding response OmpR family regulator